MDVNEQPVTQYTYSNIINYKWRIIQNGDGTVRIMPAVSNSRALDVYGGTDTTKTFNGRSFPKRDGIDCQIVDYSGNSHQKWVLEGTSGYAQYSHDHIVYQGGIGELAIIPVTQTVRYYFDGTTITQLFDSSVAAQCNQIDFVLGEHIISLSHAFYEIDGSTTWNGQYTAQNSNLMYENRAYYTHVLNVNLQKPSVSSIIFKGQASNSSLTSPPGTYGISWAFK